MKVKIKLSKLLALVLVIFSLAISTAYAATTHGAYALLVFGVGALNEVTVYQITTNKGAMTVAGLALTNIEFNTTTQDELWDNATVAGSDTQNQTYPILYVDNTGTTNVAPLNISASDDIANQDSCLDLRYYINQSEGGVFTSTTLGATATDLNTTEVQIDASFTPTEANWGIWLYGNFSACTQGEDSVTFWINATFA